jgi:hypothetical protein
MINSKNAKLIGTGEFVKGSAYQVYELDGRYYSIIVNLLDNKWDEDTITEIKFEDIHFYI